MKRIYCLLVALAFGFILLVSNLSSPALATANSCYLGPGPNDTVVPEQLWEAEMQDWGTIVTQDAGSNVNVRSGPGLDYEVIGQLHDGDRVVMTGYAMAADCEYTWYRLMVATGDSTYPVAYVWVRHDFFEADYGRGLFWF